MAQTKLYATDDTETTLFAPEPKKLLVRYFSRNDYFFLMVSENIALFA